jgi:hypothetical protein
MNDQLRGVESLLAELPGPRRPRLGILSGDIPQNERAPLRRNPPEMLVANPDIIHFELLQKPGHTLTVAASLVYGDPPEARIESGRLVQLANERGGKDNITALVVSSGPSAAQASAEQADIDQRAEILRRIPLFQYMTYKELIALLAIVKARQFQAGQFIVKEGELGDEMFVLFRGKVEIQKGGSPITTLKAGGHFGEMALVDQAPRSATVTARTDTEVLVIEREGFYGLLAEEQTAVKLLWGLVRMLNGRLRSTSDELTALKMGLKG